MRPRLPHRSRGFTMAEILIVLTILGVLAAIAAPNLMDMVRTQRIKTASFDVFSSMNVARSEAIKRNRPVSVRPNGGDWARGWQIYDSAGTVIKEQPGWEDLQLAGPGLIQFTSSGRLNGAVANLSLTARDIPASKYRCIMLDTSGRAVSKEGAC
jgi:type IV fimbrial biogenesis protein FimT